MYTKHRPACIEQDLSSLWSTVVGIVSFGQEVIFTISKRHCLALNCFEQMKFIGWLDYKLGNVQECLHTPDVSQLFTIPALGPRLV